MESKFLKNTAHFNLPLKPRLWLEFMGTDTGRQHPQWQQNVLLSGVQRRGPCQVLLYSRPVRVTGNTPFLNKQMTLERETGGTRKCFRQVLLKKYLYTAV